MVDLARAHVVSINRLLENKQRSSYEFFNIGTGHGYSVMQLVKTFIEVNGVDVKYQITDRRAGDIEKIWADTTLANEELGWEAEKTLEETLKSAWAWEKKVRNIK